VKWVKRADGVAQGGRHFSSPIGALFSLGLRPGPFFEMFLFALRAGFYLTENVFMGHAARAFLPSGRCSLWACGPGFFPLRAFCLRRGTFCSPKKSPKNGSLRWPCGASRLTRNPLGAFLLRAHQRGSRSAVQNLERVSTAV